jgi:hypothetical protein
LCKICFQSYKLHFFHTMFLAFGIQLFPKWGLGKLIFCFHITHYKGHTHARQTLSNHICIWHGQRTPNYLEGHLWTFTLCNPPRPLSPSGHFENMAYFQCVLSQKHITMGKVIDKMMFYFQKIKDGCFLDEYMQAIVIQY